MTACQLNRGGERAHTRTHGSPSKINIDWYRQSLYHCRSSYCLLKQLPLVYPLQGGTFGELALLEKSGRRQDQTWAQRGAEQSPAVNTLLAPAVKLGPSSSINFETTIKLIGIAECSKVSKYNFSNSYY